MNGNCGECEFRWDCKINPAVCENMTRPVMTNADKIRAMTDEEIAVFLLNRDVCDRRSDSECRSFTCKKCMLNWLQQPAEVDHAKE